MLKSAGTRFRPFAMFESIAGNVAKIAARTAEYERRFLSPFVAAQRGYIDEVIMPHATRMHVSCVLVMLRRKKLDMLRPPARGV